MFKRSRKPRTKSKPMYIDGIHHINGYPYHFDTYAENKIYDRVSKGLCPGCGNKECRCKSK